MNISQQYIEGIKEGRTMFEWWKRDGFLTKAFLEENIASIERLHAKLVPLANTKDELPFLKGQMDFLRHQLKEKINA